MAQEQEVDLQVAWEAYASRLRSFLARRVRRPSDAEDLLQEVFLKAHEKLSSLRDVERLDRWLFQIARNALIDRVRRQGGLSALDREVAVEGSEAYEQARAELALCVRPFVNQLPVLYGAAVTEIDLEGGSQKDLAKRLGLSHSAVKSRVQRGRRMLAQAFARCCRLEFDTRRNVVGYEGCGPESCGC